MELRIISQAGTEYELNNNLPASLKRYKIEDAIPWGLSAPVGEILMQQITTSMGSIWDTRYHMLEDCILIGRYNHPVTEMQNALSNTFACEMNGRPRVTSREGHGRITHYTHMDNFAYLRKGEYHTRDLHMIPAQLADIANDHPKLQLLLNLEANGRCGEVDGQVIVRGKIEWMMEELINPYCAPGQIQTYRDNKFSEIIMGALWQIDRKAADRPLKITDTMRDKAIAAAEYIRTHYSEPINYIVLQQKLEINIQYLKIAFKDHFGYTMDEYLRYFRMHAAHNLLLGDPHLEISAVALAVGYGNPRAFTNAFKDCFGFPPTALQK